MLVKPSGQLSIETCSDDPAETLKALQDAVGGYIEAIMLRPDLVAFCNEDYAAMVHPQPNPVATDLLRALGSRHVFSQGEIWGSLVFIGTKYNEEVSLTEAQMREIAELHTIFY